MPVNKMSTILREIPLSLFPFIIQRPAPFLAEGIIIGILAFLEEVLTKKV